MKTDRGSGTPEWASDVAGSKADSFSESGPRIIPTPEYSRKYFSEWVFEDWCWSVFTACWLCFEKGLGAMREYKKEGEGEGKEIKA